MLSEIPKFNAAQRYGRTLLMVGVLFAALGAALEALALAQATIPWLPNVPVPRALALGYLGAALWIAAGGFLSSAILSFGRQRVLAAEIGAHQTLPSTLVSTDPLAAASGRGWQSTASQVLSRLRTLLSHLKFWDRYAELMARWPPPILAMLCGVLALIGIYRLWRLPAEPPVDAVVLQVIAAMLVLAAFPLLVLQRIYANTAVEWLPEAPQLERLLRLPLAACIALATALVLLSAGSVWAIRIERGVGILILIVTLELMLRCLTIIFMPFAPIERRQSLADSSLAGGLLRLGVPNLRTINIAVRRQLGIDLSRSWALEFIRRAALPVVLGIGLFAWAVTGVTALGLNERGIYERFGVPVAVFGPGLHLHLPWPLGAIRPVEIGVVHLLPIEFLLPGGANANASSSVGADTKATAVAAEASAPASADRLWTDDHPFEGSYIIASAEHGEQSFQLVNIDMAVTYRVGLTEAAARDAAYRVTDIDELIQALSGQLLVRYFSSNTLLDLLGRSRETFTQQFQTALQAELDHFSTGVEAIGVSVEAIHPPPGAATAYHGVQAAEIRANTRISVRRGDATRSLMVAQQTVIEDRDAAVAAAAERVGQAQGQSVVFAGDKQAYAQDGYPFLLERWLTTLSRGLGQSQVVLIDHRLNAQSMPALDLRNLRGVASNEGVPATPPTAQGPNGAPQSSGGALPYGGGPQLGGSSQSSRGAESSGASQPGEATDEN
jgi:regulator of protease activity HflC (stomatin/prohibitin superfamily)